MSKAQRKPRTKSTPEAPPNDDALIEVSREQQIRDLEYPLNDAMCMAALVSSSLQQAFDRDPTSITGNPYWYHFDAEKVNVLIFAIHHLERMLKDLRSRYHKAREGTDV